MLASGPLYFQQSCAETEQWLSKGKLQNVFAASGFCVALLPVKIAKSVLALLAFHRFIVRIGTPWHCGTHKTHKFKVWVDRIWTGSDVPRYMFNMLYDCCTAKYIDRYCRYCRYCRYYRVPHVCNGMLSSFIKCVPQCVILYPLWPPPPASQQALFRATGGQHRPVRKANVRNLNKFEQETALPSSTKPIYIWERICHYNSRSPTKSIVWIQDPLATVMSLLKGTRSILRSQTCKHVAACEYSKCFAYVYYVWSFSEKILQKTPPARSVSTSRRPCWSSWRDPAATAEAEALEHCKMNVSAHPTKWNCYSKYPEVLKLLTAIWQSIDL